MRWIWQQPRWPRFSWDQARLAPLEARFLHESGRRVGAWRHLAERDQTDLRIAWLSDEAVDTSAIEGEKLNRASVQSSIRRHFGLGVDPRRVSPAEAGVAEVMVEVYRTFAAPLDHETLWRWHGTLMRERRWLAVIGGYRQHQEPMQVVSGPDYHRRIHYEAPPSHLMMTEMDRFIGWYERTRGMPALTRGRSRITSTSSASIRSRMATAGLAAHSARRRWPSRSANRP